MFWLGDQRLAVGDERDSISAQQQRAAVWTSANGVRWRRQDVPFGASGGRSSWANGACRLPGGDALVVGEGQADTNNVPMVWRQSSNGWTRVGRSVFGGGAGWLSSCVERDGVTLLHGLDGRDGVTVLLHGLDGRDPLWRTSNVRSFEHITLGGHGDSFETVRSLASGFAVAGAHTAGGRRAAVVWLSRDGEHWRAVTVPSDRPLDGGDVLDWDGRLVVALTSAGDPEVWILENAAELLGAPDGGS